MGGLLHLVQQGGERVGPQPAQLPPRCTKCCSPPIMPVYQSAYCCIMVRCSAVLMSHKGLKTYASRVLSNTWHSRRFCKCAVHVTGTGSLQLFVGKDGKAVLGSAARTSTQLTQPVSCASSTSTSHQTR